MSKNHSFPVKINVNSGGYHLVIDLYSGLLTLDGTGNVYGTPWRTYGRKIGHQHGEILCIIS